MSNALDKINAESQAFLSGKTAAPPRAIIDPNGPVWSRHYSDDPDASDCEMLDQTLKALGAKRMVVGHTVHIDGVRSACDDKVWMIDVGMAAHYGGSPAALELTDGQVKILR